MNTKRTKYNHRIAIIIDDTSYYHSHNSSIMSATDAMTIIAPYDDITCAHVEDEKKGLLMYSCARDDSDFSKPLSAARLSRKTMSLETRDDKLKIITENRFPM